MPDEYIIISVRHESLIIHQAKSFKRSFCMNYDDKQLLGDICQLADTGMEAAGTVLKKVEEPALREEIEQVS